MYVAAFTPPAAAPAILAICLAVLCSPPLPIHGADVNKDIFFQYNMRQIGICRGMCAVNRAHSCGLQGFDEYMNLVLDEAEEVSVKRQTRKTIGVLNPGAVDAWLPCCCWQVLKCWLVR